MYAPTSNVRQEQTSWQWARVAALLLVVFVTAACTGIPQIVVTPTADSPSTASDDCVAPNLTDGSAAQESGGEPSTTLPADSAAGTPAGEATTERVIAAAWNMVNCWNSGEVETLVALWTPELLQNQFGITDPEVASFALANLPPLAVDSFGDVQVHEGGVVSLDAVYRREVGQHMLVHERWYFRPQGEALLLDQLVPLPIEIEGEAVEIDAQVGDQQIELSESIVAAGSTLVFHVANTGTMPHEFAVFRLQSPQSAQEIVQAGELPPGSDITGAAFALPGAEPVELVLVDLEPGYYVVICNLENEDGGTHLLTGEVATFTVE